MPSDRKQVNVRLPDQTLDQLNDLCRELGQSQAGVIGLAVRALAKRELPQKAGLKKSGKKSDTAIDSV